MGKEKKLSAERILYDVKYTLAVIIEKNKGSFKKEGDFKVRPGYGYDKFYLDRVDGSYDMSLQGLIHYILHDDHLYEKFLSLKMKLRPLRNFRSRYMVLMMMTKIMQKFNTNIWMSFTGVPYSL